MGTKCFNIILELDQRRLLSQWSLTVENFNDLVK